MAPELLSNEPYIPKYVDIYALGVCLFYIVTKQYPCFLRADTTDKNYKYIYKKEYDDFWNL